MKLVKVRFLKSHSRMAYFAGEHGEVKTNDLSELLDGGYVELLEAEKPESKTIGPEVPERPKRGRPKVKK